jgi:hypothetical protein
MELSTTMRREIQSNSLFRSDMTTIPSIFKIFFYIEPQEHVFNTERDNWFKSKFSFLKHLITFIQKLNEPKIRLCGSYLWMVGNPPRNPHIPRTYVWKPQHYTNTRNITFSLPPSLRHNLLFWLPPFYMKFRWKPPVVSFPNFTKWRSRLFLFPQHLSKA